MTLSVSDPQRSLQFYQGLFGMPIQAHQGSTTILRIGPGPQFVALSAVGRMEDQASITGASREISIPSIAKSETNGAMKVRGKVT